MATVPNNILINVKTYQTNELAYLLNMFVGISISNKTFKDFQNKTANLGDTITFELPTPAVTQGGLVVNAFQQTQLLLQNLVCSQASNSNSAYNDQQFLFNVDKYMKDIGESRILALGSEIERDILRNISSSVTVNDPQSPNFGQIVDPTSGPYRYYGDGRMAINSQVQLAQAVANFEDFGAAKNKQCAILPSTRIPQFIDNMSSKFAPVRNDEIVTDWMLGKFSGFDWYESNLLPQHIAGNVGKANTTLTLVSTNDPSGNNVTQLTFSGATPNDLGAIVAADRFTFIDGVSGQPDMRFLQFYGQGESEQPVQCRVTSVVSGADGSGNVTVNIYPALKSTFGPGKNINNALNAGMQVTFANSCKFGVLMSGDQFFLAMPQLPDMQPYPTVTTVDKESGASIRHYWGAGLGNQVRGYIWDAIWGSCLVANNCMAICFPLN